jgi:uncharacterized protein (DUF2132 family)
MNDEKTEQFKNNPLHGLGLKALLIELEGHYGFEILFAYLNINCFKTNPSIEASVKFLKKTDWAREKVEVLYLYEYKNLPRVSSEQFRLSPRDRIVPEGQVPGEPKELSLEDAEKRREIRDKKTAEFGKGEKYHEGKKYGSQRNAGYSQNRGSYNGKSDYKSDRSSSSAPSPSDGGDPWAKYR